MRLLSEATEDGLRCTFVGDLEGAECGCLEAFWEHRIRDPAPKRLVLDFSSTDSIDAQAVAVLTSLITDFARLARSDDPAATQTPPRVRLVHPPQLLAHTLYKLGRLQDGTIALETRPTEEPYAG